MRTNNLSPIIHVDQSDGLVTPPWFKRFQHPRIQNVGPTVFDVRLLYLHTIDAQRAEWLRGNVIYEHHLRHRMLRSDLGLREFQAINARGVDFYKFYFGKEILVAWRSVALDQGGDLYVPFLNARNQGQSLILDWCWIGNGHFHAKGVAPRLP